MTTPFKVTPYRPFSGYIPYQDTVSNNPAIRNPNGTFDPLSAELDLLWSGGPSTGDPTFSNYYDYFFSGEDVRVYIDGLFDPKDELDIATFGFAIRQEKTPLYGFWSYNFDAMMNGTRVIQGEFSVYSRYPRRMTEMLEKAATMRANAASGKSDSAGVISTMRAQAESMKDEENIQKYWANSQLDRITTDPALASAAIGGDHNIFSAHPPFNFVIVYGVEETGLTTVGTASNSASASAAQRSNLDRIISTDINERKIKVSETTPLKVILQNVHLVNMSTRYESGGSPLIETYSFIARDFYFTEATSKTNPYPQKASVPNLNTTPKTTAIKTAIESALVSSTESTKPR
jgi:hypothetical protein